MSLSESDDRNPYFIVGTVGALRFKGKSYEEIAAWLHFNSVEEMHALLESWDLPGWLIGAETNSGKTTVREKSATTRLQTLGPRKELPPAANATELFKERLEALLKSLELLEHIDEGLHEGPRRIYFARTNVETVAGVDGVASLPGGIAPSPSEIEATLIGVYALAGGQRDLLLEALHPDSLSASAETREAIRVCVEGSKTSGDSKDGLRVLARHLATWVRGGKVGKGKPSERSEMDHAVASIMTKYRKDGLTDEEITRKIALLEKEDGTSYTVEDVAELGDLGLSWH